MEEKAVQNFSIGGLACRRQPREYFDDESLTGLAQTMKETGILQPLLARRDGSEFIVVDGERRLRAARMAGLTQVPVIVDDRQLTETEVIYRQLVANCRDELRPLEKAQAIQRWIELTKLPASQVAVKLGMSPSTVAKLLALLKLPEAVQQQVASGALSVTGAYALSQAPDAETQVQLADEAVNGGLTREAVTKRVRERKSRRRATCKGRVRPTHIVLPFAEGCEVRVMASSMSLERLAVWLSAFLDRINRLAPSDMALADAAKLLASSAREEAQRKMLNEPTRREGRAGMKDEGVGNAIPK